MFDKTPPKGMRDILPEDLLLREKILDTIKKVYRSYGFTGIETPCVEDLGLLTSKQGGDNEKLIFKILKRGEKLENACDGDLCDLGLRYDLTVPLTRYYANNCGKLPSVFKAMQMGSVWRAERPQKGRFRQFVQCDIDIINEESFLAETELILATGEALERLGLSDFCIRINDRRLLKALVVGCGFDESSFDKVFITLDKLDKIGVDGVENELAESFDRQSAQKLVKTVESLNNGDSCEALEKVCELCPEAGESLKSIFGTVKAAGFDKVRLDPSLVRGMNYYTGTIFEISYGDYGISIGGGGRYDELLGKLLGGKVCACGFSIGFERIFNILKDKGMTVGDACVKTVYLVEKNTSPAALAALFADASQKRSEGNICLVLKKIKNFGFQLNTLKQAGYSEFFLCSEQGIKQLD